MDVTYTHTELRSIYLPEANVRDIIERRLSKFLDGGEYLRVEDGKVYLKQDDPEWRHGSVREETVREATELDKAIFLIFKALDK